MEELCDWVRSGGGSVDRVTVSGTDDGGRSLVAAQDTAPNSVVLAVPGKMVFSVYQISDVLREILDSIPSEVLQRSEATDLLLALLYERHHPHSRWKPFLDSQPTAFTSPVLTTLPGNELEGSPIEHVVRQLRNELEDIYKSVIPWLSQRYPRDFEPSRCSLDAFLWAHGICESRGFRVVHDGAVRTILVPLADMANHSVGGTTFADSFDPERGFELRTGDHCGLLRGQELLLKYGELTNAELLIHYGFAVLNNPYDRVEICLDEAPAEDEDFDTQVKRAILLELGAEFGLNIEHALSLDDCDASGTTSTMEKLLASTRLHVATADELGSLTAQNLRDRISVSLSERCEREAVQVLLGFFNSMLDAYPTTVEEDHEALAKLSQDHQQVSTERFAHAQTDRPDS